MHWPRPPSVHELTGLAAGEIGLVFDREIEARWRPPVPRKVPPISFPSNHRENGGETRGPSPFDQPLRVTGRPVGCRENNRGTTTRETGRNSGTFLLSDAEVIGLNPLDAPAQAVDFSFPALLNRGLVMQMVLDLNFQTSLDPPSIAGRIKHFVKNWQKITKDPVVLDMVRGLSLEWAETPHQCREPSTPKFSKAETRSLNSEIQKMLEKGAIEQVQEEQNQFVSTLFLVPKRDGGNRPVINLKQLNRFIQYRHFKMEGIHMVKELLEKQDYMCKLDLKDAYFCVPVKQSQRKFLKFRWKRKIFQFTCMAFGLAPGPRCWTKLLKPLVGFLRRLGIRLIIFLDDMLIMARDRQTVMKHRDTVLYCLQAVGLVINQAKSQLIPVQVIEFLGFSINSIRMMFYLPQDKVTDIQQLCRQVLTQTQVTVRFLASLVGKMVATMRAVVPATLQCRELQIAQIQALLEGKCYDDHVAISNQMKESLSWWLANIEACNGRAIITPAPDLVIEADACNTGWGGTCGNDRTGGGWSQEEANYHINAKELLAASLSVQSFTKNRQALAVHVRLDNVTAVAYLSRMGGTKSPLMNRITRDLWAWCSQREITLSVEHIPGVSNQVADFESRNTRDSSDWKLSPEFFAQIQTRMGQSEIDLFASRLNRQLTNYVSWRSDPQAVATDAFQMSWTNLKAYLFPPFSLIGRCLAKIKKDQAVVTMVTPIWQAQPWYPMLLEMSIEHPIRLPVCNALLVSPQEETHPLVLSNSLHLAAWRISGIAQKTMGYQHGLEISSPTPGNPAPEQLTRAPGESGIAGVVGRTVIRFTPLWGL